MRRTSAVRVSRSLMACFRRSSRSCSIGMSFPSRSRSRARRERRCDLVQEARELSLLIPRGEAKGHVADAGLEVAPELRTALRGTAGHRPALDEVGLEVRRVVAVEERLALVEGGLPVLVDVDVVVERAAESGGVASLLARHGRDPGPLLAELVG